MSIVQDSNQSFWKNKSGSTAMMASIFLPALIGFGVLAVDVGHYYSLRTEMQQATDISGLAVLTQIRNAGDTELLSVSDAESEYGRDVPPFANRNMPKAGKNDAVLPGDVQFGHWDFNTKTFNSSASAVPANAVKIDAKLSEARDNAAQTFFGKIFRDNVDITVASVAVLPVPASFHILSPNANGALTLQNSDLDIPRTLVNSRSERAIDAGTGENELGGFVRAAGSTSDFAREARSGQLVTGVDPVADFLRYMPEPAITGACSPVNIFDEPDPIIPAGRYCGGLFIRNFNNATLSPGTFIIENGPLVVESPIVTTNASGIPEAGIVQGDGVLLYFRGRQSSMQIRDGVFNIRAQSSGPYAGVAVFGARGNHAPPILLVQDASTYFAGIFYAPDSHIDLFNANFNGICTQVCVVAQTMRIGGAPRAAGATALTEGVEGKTQIDYGSMMQTRSSPFTPVGTEPLPPTPPALRRTFRPYIISG
ncbi:MAG: TadG family pilus assembly protein [Pseudomonadota bacterium]